MGETDDFEGSDGKDGADRAKHGLPLYRYFQFQLSAGGRRVWAPSGEQRTEFHFDLTIGIIGGIAGLVAILTMIS